MNAIRRAYHILHHLGPRFAVQRIGIALRKRLGVAQRVFRSRPWETIQLADITAPGTPTDIESYARFRTENSPRFLFPLGQPPTLPDRLKNAAAGRQPDFATRLAALRENRCVYFFRALAPNPIDWYSSALDDAHSEPGRPWYEIPDYLPDQGDPRVMWEPSRAAWAIDLARAPAHGLMPDAADVLWRWIESWMAACPPFEGFQWKCGQESSVRFVAIALGVWSHGRSPAMAPQRWLQFARLAWATGYRVAHHIDYAISQKNNHAISEALGLMLVAHLFPEFRDSPGWWKKGRAVLSQELRRQIYADGSYVQHSMNYERVMLHGATLSLRLAELANEPFERDLYDSLGRCGEFLFQMTDPHSGLAPNHGNNDGAWVLPLSECDFTDFRPVIQSTNFLVNRKPRLEPGPWDEDLFWLLGEHVEQPPPAASSWVAPRAESSRRDSTPFDAGGYYTLRTPESWAMVRCHTYRDRPAHCDQLHLDLWWKGCNVLLDAGTHRYYVPGRPDLERYFKSVRAHNNIEIDGNDPLELVSRFLFLPWPRAERLGFDAGTSGTPHFEGQTFDYDRRPWHVLHRRAVRALDDLAWLVVDDLVGEGVHEAIGRWHMQDFPTRVNESGSVTQETPNGPMTIAWSASREAVRVSNVLRASDAPDQVRGWISPYYAHREAAVTLESRVREKVPLRICTIVAFNSVAMVRVATDASSADVEAGSNAWALRFGPLTRNDHRVIQDCALRTNVEAAPPAPVPARSHA